MYVPAVRSDINGDNGRRSGGLEEVQGSRLDYSLWVRFSSFFGYRGWVVRQIVRQRLVTRSAVHAPSCSNTGTFACDVPARLPRVCFDVT
jgi:hypothetical protein